MTRFIQMNFLVSLVTLMTACNPSDCEGDNCKIETLYGKMEILPSIDGVPEESIFEWNGNRYFTEDGPMEVPVGVQDVYVGNPAIDRTLDGNLRHVSDDGREWFADVVNPEIREGKLTTIDAPLTRYFEGNFACSRDQYHYNEDAEDFKGEFRSYYDDPVQHIYVGDNHKVYPEDDANMNSIGVDNYFEVHGDHLFLVVTDGATTYIAAEEIGQDFFSVTLVRPSGMGNGVNDLYCQKL